MYLGFKVLTKNNNSLLFKDNHILDCIFTGDDQGYALPI